MIPSLRCFAAAALLLAGAAAAECRLQQAASLPLVVDHGLLFVPGSINGHAARFLLDTTADSILLPEAARALDLFPILSPRLRGFEFLDEAKRGPVEIEDLRLGDLALPGTLLHVIGKPQNFGAADEIAVLGRDILRRYDVEIDVAAGRLTLYQPQGCETANLARWSDHAGQLPMLAGDNLLYYRILDFSWHIPEMMGVFVPARVNGHEAVAVLDSASRQTSLSSAAADSFGVARIEPGRIQYGSGHSLIVGRLLEGWQGVADSIGLDQEVMRSAPVLIHRFEADEELSGTDRTGSHFAGHQIFTADMILGADFLLSHHVLLSYSQQKLYFSPPGAARPAS